jgi:hypothetical protein
MGFLGCHSHCKGREDPLGDQPGYSCAEFGVKNTLSTRFRADQQGICIEAEQKKR